MSYAAKVYKVVIASPGDVKEEREITRNVIHKWNDLHSEKNKIVLLPIGWETHTHPDSGDRPQAIVNKQLIETSDLFIGIFWTKIGSPTGEAESGTVEEIEKHIEAGKPAMLYFSNKEIGPNELDYEQHQKVLAFKNKYKGKSLYYEISDSEKFGEKLYEHLVLKVDHSEYFKQSISSNKDSIKENSTNLEITDSELSIMKLLAEKRDEQSETTIKTHLRESGFSSLDCNAAISSLVEKAFIRQTKTEPVVYRIFPKGYQWAMQNKELFDNYNVKTLSDEAKQLLSEAVKSSDGVIMKLSASEGLTVQTNKKSFTVSSSPRAEALWEGAVEELEENEFIRDKGYKGEVFKVTNKGYNYADKL